jgi:peptidyl-prolyl cis-trans isomerase A (cyclophilin A)
MLAGAILTGCPKEETKNAASQSETKPAAAPQQNEETKVTETTAPAEYSVELDTTKGAIVIDVRREWAPHGADRFYELVKNGYYADAAFFRVIGGFMAQVGINADPAINATWREKRIPDDPVKASNARGTVTFATSGPDSRTTQFFINFADNSRLDGMGFAPFGKVKDMAPVDALYDGYGEGAPRGRGPSQALIQSQGNTYLRESFPKLDYIKSAKIIE